MDTLASLALATEPPTLALLDNPPYKRNEGLVTTVMWRNICCQGLYQLLVLSLVLFCGDYIFGVQSGRNNQKWDYDNGVHYTLFFNIFVFMQVQDTYVRCLT